MDCSTPVLDAETPERAKLLRVQYGSDALVRELRQTYAPRLAGLFWDQQESAQSRLVVRLSGEGPVETRRLWICGEPLIVAFLSGQKYTREALEKLHADNLKSLRSTSGIAGNLRRRTDRRDRVGNLHAGSRGPGYRGYAARSGNPAWRIPVGRDDISKGPCRTGESQYRTIPAVSSDRFLQTDAGSCSIAFQSSAAGFRRSKSQPASPASSRSRATNASP